MKSSYLIAVLESLDEDSPGGWIGFDLDGTIAEYDEWRGIYHIGKPISAMIERIKTYLAKGVEVRIFTARAAQKTPEESQQAIEYIQAWTLRNIGVTLKVTNQKDFMMIRLYDDRAVGVIENTGKILVAPSKDSQVL